MAKRHNKRALKDAKTECPECDGTGELDNGNECEDCNGTGYVTDAAIADSSLDLHDTFTMDSVRKTADGYMVAFAKVARAGIQIYKGHELGRPELDEVRVYRDPKEVFNKDAMASFAHRPITLLHPEEMVDAANWKKFAGGMTGEDIARDGETIRVPMLMMDQALIDAYEKKGIKELSWGYHTDLKWGKGTTDKGETFDARQTNIRGNHLALVPAARAGHEFRVGDSNHKSKQPGAKKMATKTIMVDGLPVEIEDRDAVIVQKQLAKDEATIKDLNEKLAKSTADAAAAKAASDAVVADLTTKSATKDGEIVVLKKQVEDAKVTPEKLSAMVKDRQLLIAKARTLLDAKYAFDAKSDDEIRKDAVIAKLGDQGKAMTDAATIAGAFNALTHAVKDSGTQTLKDGIQQFHQNGGSDATDGDKVRDTAFAEGQKHLTSAWQNGGVAK